jgi:hypothetical protein
MTTMMTMSSAPRGKPVAQLSPVVARPATLVGYRGDQIEFVGDAITPVAVDWTPDANRRAVPRKQRRR